MVQLDLAGFVAELLDQRGLSSPTGEPLYTYRVTDAEFGVLNQRVHAESRSVLRGRPVSGPCAAFVLWAAENWRRDESPGRWNNWDKVLTELGLAGFSRQRIQIYVRQGLSFWKRDVALTGDRSRYLATLVCEGGLPLHMIKHEGAALRRYFRRLLLHFRQFGAGDTALEDVAERERDLLPRTLRQPTTYGLAANLVQAAWNVQALVADARDPIAALDLRDPRWRERFPLRLDEELAKRFLGGLVVDAAETARRGALPRIHRLLIEDSSGFHLEAEVELPPLVAVEDMAAMFGWAKDSGPVRFELELATDEGAPRRIALVTSVQRQGGAPEYRIEAHRRADLRVQGPAALGRLRVAVHSHRSEYRDSSATMVGGEPLGEQPWIFTTSNGDGIHNMLSDGSCRTRLSSVVVALPDEVTVDEENASDAIEELGGVTGAARRLVRVSGHFVLRNRDGDRWSVRTGDSNEDSLSFGLVGRFARFIADGDEPFLGVPDVVARLSMRSSAPYPRQDVQWRAIGRERAWRSDLGKARGHIELRLVENGETRVRRRIRVLPESAVIALCPMATSTSGRIRLIGFCQPSVSIAQTPGAHIEFVPTLDDDTLEFHYTADGESPLPARLELDWCGATPITLAIPPPIRAVRFVGGRNATLAPRAAVAVDDLIDMFATVTTRRNEHFELHGELVPHEGPKGTAIRRLVHFRLPLHEVSDCVHQIELRHAIAYVQRALLVQPWLDARVRLYIMASRDPKLPLHEISVYRYTNRLQQDFEAGIITGPRGLRGLGVCARPVWDAIAGAVELPAISTLHESPSWSVKDALTLPGPWLLYGHVAGRACTRAALWWVGERPPEDPDPEVPESANFSEAARAPNAIREAAWRLAIAAMAEDPGHPDWKQIIGLVRTTTSLPATTFEVFRHLPAEPVALAMMFLHSARFEDAFDAVWRLQEQLPFRWSCLPIRAWATAAKRFDSWLDQQLREVIADSAARVQLRVDAIRSVHRLIPESANAALFVDWIGSWISGLPMAPASKELRFAASLQGRAVLLNDIVEDARELRRRHAEHPAWPVAPDVERYRSASVTRVGSVLDEIDADAPPLRTRAAIRAPIVAALLSLEADPPSPLLVYQISRCRAFDVQAFDDAHGRAIALLLSDLRFAEELVP